MHTVSTRVTRNIFPFSKQFILHHHLLELLRGGYFLSFGIIYYDFFDRCSIMTYFMLETRKICSRENISK